MVAGHMLALRVTEAMDFAGAPVLGLGGPLEGLGSLS